MPRSASKYPTELELLILKVLWGNPPMLARDVQAALAASGRALAKTSVITTLNTMFGKRYLSRKKQGNTYLFSPRISEKQVNSRVLDDVVDRVFAGSTRTGVRPRWVPRLRHRSSVSDGRSVSIL
jgi:BlaI family transcriptional regulator, penicillinase repressor